MDRASRAAGDRPRRIPAVEAACDLAALLARCRAVLQRRIDETAAAVWGLERLVDETGTRPSVDPGVSLVAGQRGIQRTLAHFSTRPTRHRTALHSQQVPAGWSSDAAEAADATLLRQGVSLRAVYPLPEAGLSPQQHRYLLRQRRMGVDVRLMETVPMDLFVVDQDTAVLPADPDHPGWGLVVVQDPRWVETVALLADTCWNSAIPYTAGRQTTADEPAAGRGADAPSPDARDAARTILEEGNAHTEHDVPMGAQPVHHRVV